MKLQLSIDVLREGGKPLFDVSVYDLDEAVNFHSFSCVWIKQGNDLPALLEELKASEYKEVINDLKQLL